jgi:hypothetical protein
VDIKTPDGPEASTHIDKKSMTALADQLEERARVYLSQCSKTMPNAERDTTWSQLYAGAHRLRLAVLASGGNRIAVADAVLEIGSNLLGCEEIAVLKLDADDPQFSILASIGITAEHRNTLNTHTAKIWAEINRGQVSIVDKNSSADQFLASLGITALVPLTPPHNADGAIVFFNLLPQRHRFDSGDREILGLLSVYVGPCLFGQ